MAPSALLLASILAVAQLFLVHATQVAKCRDHKIAPPKSEDVQITDCNNPPCRLRKRTEPAIEMKIVPEKDAPGVITSVNAQIVGIPFPFIGVDGTSACGNIYSEDGKTKLGCPLKAGQAYLYKNSFKILDIYPKIKLTVQWGLVNNKTNEDIACFELPSKIV